ncbi:MAG: glycoside hydrolase family 3 protein [Lachnospiraceae bacterium]|nr:glycoside hydrolase family 3 protein [Lachnospiraceae bacterium]
MSKFYLDNEKYAALARRAAAEGAVLLKNPAGALPLKKGDKVALFGRCAVNYYKSGLGSGGLVNTKYVVNVLQALQEETEISLCQPLVDLYDAWLKENPVDEGEGWGKVPWSQKEMKWCPEMEQASKEADVAIVVIGRTAGEDQDSRDEAGSYRMTEDEVELMREVAKRFPRTAIVLNVGNIMDMSWEKEVGDASILYAWQGGQEGGHAIADVLTGRVNPCGHLTDTIAKKLSDYPSDQNFGNPDRDIYQEDIYVGYRYFETFNQEAVLYPFGYGLSYTNFSMQAVLEEECAETSKDMDLSCQAVKLTVRVTNTGAVAGKEAVQVYVEAPQGKLGKPSRVLAEFAKTDVIQPGETKALTLEIPYYQFASYDDAGLTGHKSVYILEAGDYKFYVGDNVRDAGLAFSIELKEQILQQAEEALAPVISFERMRPQVAFDGESLLDTIVNVKNGDAHYKVAMEPVPVRTVNPWDRCRERMPEEIPYTGNQGIKLVDVLDGKATLDAFVAQLSDLDLRLLHRGEGMSSPKVTPGTGSAFGGLHPSLRELGIPAACTTDGPSGLRLDCGTKAMSLPNGTCLGATFDKELQKELFTFLGKELRRNKVEALLGPGMNIHRHPLNGRNFEYISEDPYLTGMICAYQLLGMEESDVTGTIKHFAANNQEWHRSLIDSVVSERALREIYLKGFEIAVREGKASSVMTTYGSLNGTWTSGCYDLNTTILRGEWGFDGIVMTDWWAKGNDGTDEPNIKNRAPMVAAQNDLYMVTSDGMLEEEFDNLKEALESGRITRGQLQRNAKNILNFILRSPAILHEAGRISQEELEEMKVREEGDILPSDVEYYHMDEQKLITITEEDVARMKGDSKDVVMGICVDVMGRYEMVMEYSSELEELAQLPISMFVDNILVYTFALQGTRGEKKTVTHEAKGLMGSNHYVKLHFGGNGLKIHSITIEKVGEMELPPNLL